MMNKNCLCSETKYRFFHIFCHIHENDLMRSSFSFVERSPRTFVKRFVDNGLYWYFIEKEDARNADEFFYFINLIVKMLMWLVWEYKSKWCKDVYIFFYLIEQSTCNVLECGFYGMIIIFFLNINVEHAS